MPTTDTTPTAEPTCYRHRDRVTYLSCGRCGKPLCTDCAEHGPVGIRCEECLRPVGRMVVGAAPAAPEREGAGLLIGAVTAVVGVGVSIVVALAQVPTDQTLRALAREWGAPAAAIAEATPRELAAGFINAGSLMPSPNLLAAMIIGGLVGWAIWRAVGRASNRRTAWSAFLLGLAVPLIAAAAITVVVASQYGTPALFLNLSFWLRALVAAGLSGLFAWLLGTQRR